MKLKYALFLAFIFGYAALLVVSFWANKLRDGLSGTGMFLTFLLAFLATLLLCLFAPVKLLTAVVIAFLIIVFITLIVVWISG